MMRFEWDDEKNRVNIEKHGVSFELATLVFEDPLMRSVPDPFEHEERWRTMGMVCTSVIVLVVHTWSEEPADGEEEPEEIVRIISARKATRLERKAYEESE